MSKSTRERAHRARSIACAVLALALPSAGCGHSRASHGTPGPDDDAAAADGGAQSVAEDPAHGGTSAHGGMSAHGGTSAQGGAGSIAGASSVAGSAAGDATSDEPATSLTVTPAAASLISGQPVTLTVTATFPDQSTRDVTAQATFAALDATVVSLQRNVVTAYIPGHTTITVSALGLEASVAVEVRQGSVLSLSIEATNLDCQQSGYSAVFRASGVAANGTVRNVTKQVKWSTSTPERLLFSDYATGEALCLGPGTVTVSASLDSAQAELTAELRSPHVLGFDLSSPGMIRPDDTFQFSTQIEYDDFSTVSLVRYPNAARFNYVSSAPQVLAVDRSGMAQPLTLGTSTVSAVFDGKTVASALVRVSNSPLVSIAIAPSAVELTAPGRVPMTAIGTYLDATTADITGSVHWDSPVVFGGDGWATPWNAGKGSVVATLDNHRASITANVLPGAPTGIDLSFGSSTVPRFASVRPYLSARYASIPNAQLLVTDVASYQIADPSLVTVSGVPALATGVAVGTTDIVARLGTLESTSSSLTVSESQPVAFHLGFEAAGLRVGQTLHVPALVTFDDGSDYDVSTRVTFKSADPKIATVSNQQGTRGDVTGLAPGQTSITVSALGLSTTLPLEVEP